MSNTSKYGDRYWCVKVIKDLSKDREIYLHAEKVITENGALIFLGKSQFNGEFFPVLVISRDCWFAVYAASVVDGAAVAVEYWTGEVSRAD